MDKAMYNYTKSQALSVIVNYWKDPLGTYWTLYYHCYWGNQPRAHYCKQTTVTQGTHRNLWTDLHTLIPALNNSYFESDFRLYLYSNVWICFIRLLSVILGYSRLFSATLGYFRLLSAISATLGYSRPRNVLRWGIWSCLRPRNYYNRPIVALWWSHMTSKFTPSCLQQLT